MRSMRATRKVDRRELLSVCWAGVGFVGFEVGTMNDEGLLHGGFVMGC